MPEKGGNDGKRRSRTIDDYDRPITRRRGVKRISWHPEAPDRDGCVSVDHEPDLDPDTKQLISRTNN